MKDPMLDEEFLRKLDQYPHKFIWAKIISLNWDEYPLQEITGKITSGNVNVDGNSAVRRTCSLSMVANDVNINDFYWSLNTKFKMYVGVENWIDPDFPEIIWFKQGTFIISSFSCSLGTNNYTINIQGKDKMVLLNGEVGGIVPASWDFGTEDETLPDGTIQNNLIPIKDIVLQAVHEYTQEPWQNIIVNDLDDYGIELLEYTGESPLYYIIKTTASGDNDSREVSNMTLNGDMECQVRQDSWDDVAGERIIGTSYSTVKISQIESVPMTVRTASGGTRSANLKFQKLLEQLSPSGEAIETAEYVPAIIKFDGDSEYYTVAKVTRDNGLQVCGYRICDIVYPYDLIASPGDSITSGVLDKLVSMLGNFEYFYDVDGRFIFQKKKTYLDVSYNNIIHEHSINSEVWADSSEYSSSYSYVFDGNSLVSSIQNSPNLSNLKNDYSLWGTRSSGDIDIPIHMRYAIDHKPFWYKVIGHHIRRDADGNPIDKNGNPVEGKAYYYDDAGTIYCTEEGWKEYNRRIDQFDAENDEGSLETHTKEMLFNVRSGYPDKMNDPENYPELHDWWKLDDWIEIISGIIGELPTNVMMSSGAKTILDKAYADTWSHLKQVFSPGALSIADDKEFNVIDIDMSEAGYPVNYAGHGASCSHYYTSLLSSQKNGIVVWVYDPRLWDSGKVRTSSTSIYTEAVAKNLYGRVDESQVKKVDWREIIYQMANDYRRHYRDDDFLLMVAKNNIYNGIDSWYPKGYTGYEKYYVDFEMNLSQGVVAYWRELYNLAAAGTTGTYTPYGDFVSNASQSAWGGGTAYSKGVYVSYKDKLYRSTTDNNTTEPDTSNSRWVEVTDFSYDSEGWNPDILNNPEMLNFWFDFLDTTGELNKYSVCNIGQRSKATNDDKIKAIYFRETPNVIFQTVDDNVKQSNWIKPGYCYIRIPKGLDNLFKISSRGKNAMDVVEEYLYDYTYPAASVTLAVVPIYYLRPNTLIYVNDKETGACGEYIMQKFSIQLGLNLQMSINAVETAKRIY